MTPTATPTYTDDVPGGPEPAVRIIVARLRFAADPMLREDLDSRDRARAQQVTRACQRTADQISHMLSPSDVNGGADA